jgi:glutamate-ammonia-ligase adenylyltransferase
MNAEQLQKTLVASQYAEQVLNLYQIQLEQDYCKDQFLQSLSTESIHEKVQQAVADVTDEHAWMKALRVLRAKLMFRWIWQDANQLTNVVTLTRELSDFADASICAAKAFALPPP